MRDISNKEDIKILIDAFYTLALKDEEIGFFFNEVSKINLDEHMPRMYEFWNGVIFHEPGYKGNPMRVHLDLNTKSKIYPQHFDRWLELFNSTVDRLFDGVNANQAKVRAVSISTMMKIKIASAV